MISDPASTPLAPEASGLTPLPAPADVVPEVPAEALDLLAKLIRCIAAPAAQASASRTVAPLERLTLSKEQVLLVVGIGNTTLWRLEQRGLLRPMRGLRHKLYSVAEIRRYIAEATAPEVVAPAKKRPARAA